MRSQASASARPGHVDEPHQQARRARLRSPTSGDACLDERPRVARPTVPPDSTNRPSWLDQRSRVPRPTVPLASTDGPAYLDERSCMARRTERRATTRSTTDPDERRPSFRKVRREVRSHPRRAPKVAAVKSEASPPRGNSQGPPPCPGGAPLEAPTGAGVVSPHRTDAPLPDEPRARATTPASSSVPACEQLESAVAVAWRRLVAGDPREVQRR